MSQKSSKLILELYGAPGVGKTTLARRLVDEYGFVMARVETGRPRYVSLLLKYPFTVACWSVLILRNFFVNKSRKLFTYNISLLFTSLQKIDTARNSQAAKVVVDEGLVQRLLSYSEVAIDERAVRWLLAHSPISRVVVLVNDRVGSPDHFTPAHTRSALGGEHLVRWEAQLKKNLALVQRVLEAGSVTRHMATADRSIDDILRDTDPNTASQ